MFGCFLGFGFGLSFVFVFNRSSYYFCLPIMYSFQLRYLPGRNTNCILLIFRG